MTKGTFGTPRDLGSVPEIQFVSVRIRFGDEEAIDANIKEGEEVGGVFQESVTNQLHLERADMDAATVAALDNFLRALMSEYATQEGYTGVTIT